MLISRFSPVVQSLRPTRSLSFGNQDEAEKIAAAKRAFDEKKDSFDASQATLEKRQAEIQELRRLERENANLRKAIEELTQKKS